MDEEQFFKYTRMTIPVFQELLSKLKPRIAKGKRSYGIDAEERLVLKLQLVYKL